MEYVFWFKGTNVHLRYQYHILLNIFYEFNQIVVNVDKVVWKFSWMLRQAVSLVYMIPGVQWSKHIIGEYFMLYLVSTVYIQVAKTWLLTAERIYAHLCEKYIL